jgi:hypothetical protein
MTMTQRQGKQRKRRGVDYELIKVPQEFWDLAKRRTETMIRWQTERVSLAALVANAYLQGLEDGYFTAEKQMTVIVGEQGKENS